MRQVHAPLEPGCGVSLIRVNNRLMGWWLYGNHLTLRLFTRAEVHVWGDRRG